MIFKQAADEFKYIAQQEAFDENMKSTRILANAGMTKEEIKEIMQKVLEDLKNNGPK